MKLPRKLLLVLASSFLLTGCNPPAGETCPQCPECEGQPMGGGETEDPAQEELRKVVRNEINKIFDDAKKLTNELEILQLIENYRPLAIADVENLGELYDEEDATDMAHEIADGYASGEFKETIVSNLNEYFIYAITNSKDPLAVDYLLSIYERELNRFDDEGSFEGILNHYNYLVEEIKQATGVTPSLEDFSKQKDEVYSYGYEILYGNIEYLEEQPGRDYIDSEVEKFDVVTSEEDANKLVNELKAEIYAHFLNLYKNELCNDLRGLQSELEDSMTNEAILSDVKRWVESDIETINSQSSFENALHDHDASIDTLKNEVESAVHGWGIRELSSLHTHYNSLIEGDEAREKFWQEYGRAEAEINSLSVDVAQLEKEIKKILDAFETFCESLLPKE